MITVQRTQNILQTKLPALICTVNCVGVMGKGLALECKKKYPLLNERYRRAVRWGLSPGDVYWIDKAPTWEHDIILAATKNDWRHPSRLEWVAEACKQLAYLFPHWGLSGVAIPALGCGNGGLDWRDVEPLVMATAVELSDQYFDVEIYPPNDPSGEHSP